MKKWGLGHTMKGYVFEGPVFKRHDRGRKAVYIINRTASAILMRAIRTWEENHVPVSKLLDLEEENLVRQEQNLIDTIARALESLPSKEDLLYPL